MIWDDFFIIYNDFNMFPCIKLDQERQFYCKLSAILMDNVTENQLLI